MAARSLFLFPLVRICETEWNEHYHRDENENMYSFPCSRETPAEESKFDKDMGKARVLKELGVAFDSERIRRLHKVAKYLDIKFLQELTETLIMRAPSREFMEMVSPWEDYSSLEAYRSHHVEACRNLEVAVQ